VKRCGKGFTLIELLIVIAIIAILAAILFPVLAAAKERSLSTRCLNNEKQLALAFRAYMDDNDGRMPKIQPWNAKHQPPDYPADWCGSTYPVTGTQVPCLLKVGSLWPYTKNASIYLFPADRGLPAKGVLNSPRDYPLSYTVNYRFDWAYLTTNVDSAPNRRQSRVLLLIHESRDTINDGALWWAPRGTDDLPSKVHYCGTNACFLDCHAAYLRYDELVKRRDSGEWDPNSVRRPGRPSEEKGGGSKSNRRLNHVIVFCSSARLCAV